MLKEHLQKAKKFIGTVFVVAEVSFFKKIFRKIDTSEGVSKLAKELEAILTSDSSIAIIDESCVP